MTNGETNKFPGKPLMQNDCVRSPASCNDCQAHIAAVLATRQNQRGFLRKNGALFSLRCCTALLQILTSPCEGYNILEVIARDRAPFLNFFWNPYEKSLPSFVAFVPRSHKRQMNGQQVTNNSVEHGLQVPQNEPSHRVTRPPTTDNRRPARRRTKSLETVSSAAKRCLQKWRKCMGIEPTGRTGTHGPTVLKTAATTRHASTSSFCFTASVNPQ